MRTETGEQGVRARADLITAIVLVAVGLFVFYHSYNMPRLEARRVHPSTIPGLVPMLLGLALVMLGGLLGWRAWRIEAPGGWRGLIGLFGTMAAARVFAAILLVLVFTLGLMGWLPFWAASIIFIGAFTLTFEVLLSDAPLPFGRSLFWASATAIVCGGGIYYLFAEIFLVRLP